MKTLKYIFISFLISLNFTNCSFGLTMSNHTIEQFKRTICQCCRDALALKGEYKNNGYYVSLKDGTIKGHNFNNAQVKFQNLTENKRNEILDNGVTFSDLQNNLSIKVAADISPTEFQKIINDEIGRSSTARRIFNQADFSFEENAVVVNGTMNMKRVPGNPFALISKDEYSPFRVRITAKTSGSLINLEIIDGEINGQVMSPELKQVFLNWLNPLWDFSQLGFNCELKDYKITPQGLRIIGTVF